MHGIRLRRRFGAAIGDHYHTVSGVGRAMVHGDSTTDNYWHGRATNGIYLPNDKYCEAGSSGRGRLGYDREPAGYTCEIMVYGDPFYYRNIECWGYGYADVTGNISGHRHNAHNYGCTTT